MSTDPLHRLVLRGRIYTVASPALLLSLSLLAYGARLPESPTKQPGAITMAFQLRPPAAKGPGPLEHSPPQESAPAGPAETALPSYRLLILSALSRSRYYPVEEQEARHEGSVLLRLVIQSDGTLQNVSIIRPSMHAGLNRGALYSARRAAPFPPFPQNMPQKELTLEVRLVYSLAENPTIPESTSK
ncbi:MAG: energy transducer TonB [Spirochaetales bacterium]|nr:energy transducer TonB [Spirochaetales bacterium]